MKILAALILATVSAVAVAGCGAPPDDVAPQLGADTVTSSPAPTLVGTWVNQCSDTTTTLTITASLQITIVTHVDGQADQALVGSLIVRRGRLVVDQEGAELDMGAYLLEPDQLLVAGAYAGVYHRAL